MTTQKHTVTLTRQLQDQAADVFGDANQFSLKITQLGTKQYFDLTWGNRFVGQYTSRKAVHEWVINQINLGRQHA